jgi:hypothetical protein
MGLRRRYRFGNILVNYRTPLADRLAPRDGPTAADLGAVARSREIRPGDSGPRQPDRPLAARGRAAAALLKVGERRCVSSVVISVIEAVGSVPPIDCAYLAPAAGRITGTSF